MKQFQEVMVNQDKEITKLQLEIEQLKKDQSPEYHQNLENINDNFTQISKFMKTQSISRDKFSSKQSNKRARMLSNHGNALILD
jgi:DNA-binding protein H-NS